MGQAWRDPRAAIEIIANPQHDGCSYQLHPLSRRALQASYPHVSIAPSIFIGYDSKQNFENLHGKMWTQIITLLTGLSIRKLDQLGGLYIVDSAADQILYDTRPNAAALARA